MKKIAVGLGIIALLAGAVIWQQQTPDERIVFENPRIRLLPGAGPQGGFLMVRNTGLQPVTLLSAASNDFKHVMIHRTRIVDGQARMWPVDDGLLIEPGTALEFAPGGLHLMMMRPQHKKRIGESINVMLTWKNAAGEERHGDVDFRLIGAGES